jgi:hypothetical protein
MDTQSVLLRGSSANDEFLRAKLCVLPPSTTMIEVLGTTHEVDTYTSGMIRCFRVGDAGDAGDAGAVVVEETDLDTKETIWRPMADQEEADAFIADRQATYEALWIVGRRLMRQAAEVQPAMGEAATAQRPASARVESGAARRRRGGAQCPSPSSPQKRIGKVTYSFINLTTH